MTTEPIIQTHGWRASIARQISGAAAELDWIKRDCGTPQQRAEATKHLDTLHRIAENLDAGLYAAPDAPEASGAHGWESVTTGHATPECGDPVTGQPCRNESDAACGECLALIAESEGTPA